jgi:hypothetical protein
VILIIGIGQRAHDAVYRMVAGRDRASAAEKTGEQLP